MFIKVIYFFSFLIPKGLFVSKLIMWAYARQHITNIWILFADMVWMLHNIGQSVEDGVAVAD